MSSDQPLSSPYSLRRRHSGSSTTLPPALATLRTAIQIPVDQPPRPKSTPVDDRTPAPSRKRIYEGSDNSSETSSGDEAIAAPVPRSGVRPPPAQRVRGGNEGTDMDEEVALRPT